MKQPDDEAELDRSSHGLVSGQTYRWPTGPRQGPPHWCGRIMGPAESERRVQMAKMDGGKNPADALTKYVGADELCVQCRAVNLEELPGRHALHPQVGSDQ